jgi:hypothetical protein
MRVSWLNLHLWIPQKDVRKLIYSLLDSVDWKMVASAHNSTLRVWLNEAEMQICAFRGYLSLFQLAFPWISGPEYIYEYAALGGHLNIIKWAKWRRIGEMDSNTCTNAVRGGHFDLLKHVRTQYGCEWDVFTSAAAAESGQLEIFKWLIEEGCPYDMNWCKRSKHKCIVDYIGSYNYYPN